MSWLRICFSSIVCPPIHTRPIRKRKQRMKWKRMARAKRRRRLYRVISLINKKNNNMIVVGRTTYYGAAFCSKQRIIYIREIEYYVRNWAHFLIILFSSFSLTHGRNGGDLRTRKHTPIRSFPQTTDKPIDALNDVFGVVVASAKITSKTSQFTSLIKFIKNSPTSSSGQLRIEWMAVVCMCAYVLHTRARDDDDNTYFLLLCNAP